MTKLRTLYKRRLELQREIYDINRMIETLEKSNSYSAPKRIHHVSKGCGRPHHRRRPGDPPCGKVTKDWSLVDCMVCLKVRREGPRRPPRNPKDWTEITG